MNARKNEASDIGSWADVEKQIQRNIAHNEIVGIKKRLFDEDALWSVFEEINKFQLAPKRAEVKAITFDFNKYGKILWVISGTKNPFYFYVVADYEAELNHAKFKTKVFPYNSTKGKFGGRTRFLSEDYSFGKSPVVQVKLERPDQVPQLMEVLGIHELSLGSSSEQDESDDQDDPSSFDDLVAVEIERLNDPRNDEPPTGNFNPEKRRGSSNTGYKRDAKVVAWVEKKKPAPFISLRGRPFLEVHHVLPLEDKGPDTICNCAACCPNCHRALHYSPNRSQMRDELIKKTDRLKRYHSTSSTSSFP